MAASETNPGTGGRGDDRKQTPEEIAEERIEAARKSKATTLDLSRLGLTEVPVSIGRLTQLQSFYALNNQLTALPDCIGQLTELQALNVLGNQLKALPDSIGQLSRLTDLIIAENQLTALPDSLGQLNSLGKCGPSPSRSSGCRTESLAGHFLVLPPSQPLV